MPLELTNLGQAATNVLIVRQVHSLQFLQQVSLPHVFYVMLGRTQAQVVLVNAEIVKQGLTPLAGA